ncbi:MAG TPA: NADH-quinone oxidoreductase subunit NuoE [Acidimicrobiia bacterium]|jgi:NADH:ubiquinone oxidoreductase subunit E|nr:NADH-quinone oxidoreductase subunit NuoE [Acidimicrobiia bacterium]
MGEVSVESAVDLGPALRVLDEMAPVEHGHVVPLLQAIQEAYGYLPRQVLLETATRTGIPASHLYGVATFYAQFYLAEHGRHTVRVCRGTACHVRGRQAIQDAVDEGLGIHDGETTPDRRFSLETVACLGTCFLAPVVMIDHDYFGSVNAADVPEMLEDYA